MCSSWIVYFNLLCLCISPVKNFIDPIPCKTLYNTYIQSDKLILHDFKIIGGHIPEL